MSIKSDSDLDILTLRKLLFRIEKEIDGAGNRVRYSMNSFVIAAGCFVKDLTADAQKTGNAISHITVDMG